MLDADMREALTRRIDGRAVQHHGEVRVWHEMPLALGASRVDVGLINGHLSGFEIKSDRDSLARLPGQVKHYSLCLDYATVVVSSNRAQTIHDHVPDWWGVLEARATTNSTDLPRLVELRRPRMNPDLDPFHVAQMLLRPEGMGLLRAHGHADGLAKATRWDIWDRLAEVLPLMVLRAEVRRLLTVRPTWRDR